MPQDPLPEPSARQPGHGTTPTLPRSRGRPHRSIDRVTRRRGVHRTGVSVRDTERARAALDELVATADRQHLARFPAELTVGAVILGGLLSVGVIAPLVALDAPDDAVQVAFLLPFAALSMLAAGVMYFYAVLAWRAWQALPLDAWHAEHARTVEDVDRPLPPA